MVLISLTTNCCTVGEEVDAGHASDAGQHGDPLRRLARSSFSNSVEIRAGSSRLAPAIPSPATYLSR